MEKNKFKIGIMQGRLSPPINGKIQAFPWDNWKNEFEIAARIGFDHIEFIFESANYTEHPVFTKEGQKKIKLLSRTTGINVNYVCADYFMEIPFIRVTKEVRKNNIQILTRLIEHCSQIGIKGIEIPFVDNSRIETEDEMEIVIECLDECLPVAESYNVRLGLETSLSPNNFKRLLEKIDHPYIEANYDTGNSSSLGYDTQEEILTLGKWIRNIHIKDRIFKGGTVPLGEGDVDFDLFFKTLSTISYKGSFVLQTARGENDTEVATKYLKFVKQYIQKYLKE